MSTYSVSARWTSARRGDAVPDSGAPDVVFSAPPEFQGENGLWTPEHFLVAAVSSCFVTTFKAVSDFSKFGFESLEVTAEGVLEKADGGYKFTKIYVKPALVVTSETDVERGNKLLEKSERACLVSRSLSAEIVLQPTVTVADKATSHASS